MTVIARRIKATPARSASSAWSVIVSLLAPKADSAARVELENIAGIAGSLISDEAFRSSPAVVYGSGPRIRLYCLVPLRQKCVITDAICASQKIADNEGSNMIDNRQCLDYAS